MTISVAQGTRPEHVGFPPTCARQRSSGTGGGGRRQHLGVPADTKGQNVRGIPKQARRNREEFSRDARLDRPPRRRREGQSAWWPNPRARIKGDAVHRCHCPHSDATRSRGNRPGEEGGHGRPGVRREIGQCSGAPAVGCRDRNRGPYLSRGCAALSPRQRDPRPRAIPVPTCRRNSRRSLPFLTDRSVFTAFHDRIMGLPPRRRVEGRAPGTGARGQPSSARDDDLSPGASRGRRLRRRAPGERDDFRSSIKIPPRRHSPPPSPPAPKAALKGSPRSHQGAGSARSRDSLPGASGIMTQSFPIVGGWAGGKGNQ